MKNIAIITYILALILITVFMITDDIKYAVAALWLVILSAESNIISLIEKGRD